MVKCVDCGCDCPDLALIDIPMCVDCMMKVIVEQREKVEAKE